MTDFLPDNERRTIKRKFRKRVRVECDRSFRCEFSIIFWNVYGFVSVSGHNERFSTAQKHCFVPSNTWRSAKRKMLLGVTRFEYPKPVRGNAFLIAERVYDRRIWEIFKNQYYSYVNILIYPFICTSKTKEKHWKKSKPTKVRIQSEVKKNVFAY